MSKAIALAVVREQSFKPAIESAKNFAFFLADLMYGTPERLNLTYAMCFALILLGVSMDMNAAHGIGACAN